MLSNQPAPSYHFAKKACHHFHPTRPRLSVTPSRSSATCNLSTSHLFATILIQRLADSSSAFHIAYLSNLSNCQIVEHNFAGTKTRHIDQLFAKVHKWPRKLRKEGKCLSSVPKICASVSQGLQLEESDQSGKSESAPNARIKKVKVIKTAWIIKK